MASEKKKQYDRDYKKDHIKRVPLDMQFDDYLRLLAHAQKVGETVNGFIKRAIRETMKNDNSDT